MLKHEGPRAQSGNQSPSSLFLGIFSPPLQEFPVSGAEPKGQCYFSDFTGGETETREGNVAVQRSVQAPGTWSRGSRWPRPAGLSSGAAASRPSRADRHQAAESVRRKWTGRCGHGTPGLSPRLAASARASCPAGSSASHRLVASSLTAARAGRPLRPVPALLQEQGWGGGAGVRRLP